MWWLNSEPLSDMGGETELAKNSFAQSAALETIAKLVDQELASDGLVQARKPETPSVEVARDARELEALKAEISDLEKVARECESNFSSQLARSFSANEALKDQLLQVSAKAAKCDQQRKRLGGKLSTSETAAIAAKRNFAESTQKYVTEIRRVKSLLANKERRIQNREGYYREQIAEFRLAASESEQQKAQSLALQATAAAELKALVVSQQQTVSERDARIDELEKFGREAELRIDKARKQHVADVESHQSTIEGLQSRIEEREKHDAELLAQARSKLLDTEQQKEQSFALHAAATAELTAIIETHQQAAFEQEATIRRLEARLTEQADNLIELDKLGREAELKIQENLQQHFADTESHQSTIAALQSRSEEREKHDAELLDQARSKLLDTEQQKEQSLALHAAATAELTAIIETYQQAASEQEATIERLEARLTEQADNLIELDKLGREAELKIQENLQQYLAATESHQSTIAALQSRSEERERHDAELLAQARSTLLDTEQQKTQLFALHAAATAELTAIIETHRKSASEQEATIRRLEARLTEQADNLIELDKLGREAELKIQEHLQQHLVDTESHQSTIAALESRSEKREKHDAEQLLQTQSKLLDTEQQKEQSFALYAAATAELTAIIETHRKAASEQEATIQSLDARLTEQADNLIELDKLGREAEQKIQENLQQYLAATESHQSTIAALQSRSEEREKHDAELLAQTRSTLLDTEQQKTQSLALHAAATAELTAIIETYRQTASEQEAAIKLLGARLTEQANNLIKLEGIGHAVELRAHENLQQHAMTVDSFHLTIRELQSLLEAQLGFHRNESVQNQEQATLLQNRLQHEAACRRKAEAALKRALDTNDDNQVLNVVGGQFANEQLIERLSSELLATRRLCAMLQRDMNQKDNKRLNQAPVVVTRAAS